MTAQTEIYFNTTNLDPVEVQKWKAETVAQDSKVLGYFTDHPHAAFNAWEVSRATGVFITNVRRAINVLQKKGQLAQVGENIGDRGHKNYTYQFIQKT
jgi:hypothetical protein